MLAKACEAIQAKLPQKDESWVRQGYSQVITESLDPNLLAYFQKLSEALCTQSFTKSYLWFPKVTGIRVLWSFFDEETTKVSLTHAHLWHRDLDDPFGPQLKIMIPLMDTTIENGRFSVCSKAVCRLQQELRDSRISAAHYGTDEYLKTDTVRVTDSTMREHFQSQIGDIDTTLGEAVLVDTNSCYHKGGLITQPNRERILVEITLGSLSHSHVPASRTRRWFIKFRQLLIGWNIGYKDSYDVFKRKAVTL